jgi:hypothetical protein
MATPSELMKALSAATGIRYPTVFDLDRKLMEAKLRPISGRGSSAVKMTPLDAARLLTAVLASPQANEAAEAVLRYANTRPDKRRSSEGLFMGAGLDDFENLSARHSFIEGVAALIASAAGGALAKLASRAAQGPHIEVFAFTQTTHGRIRISALSHGASVNVEYVPSAAEPDARKAASKNKKNETTGPGDLEQSRRITGKTIFALAKLFKLEFRDDEQTARQ